MFIFIQNSYCLGVENNIKTGFPDIATRALVSRLSKCLKDVPVLGICDYNPFGVALMLTYKVLYMCMSLDLCKSI
jgi:hypothetical protein